MRNKTHISVHALSYITTRKRTGLTSEEIAAHNDNRTFIFIGTLKKGARLRLVWDCVLDAGIILVVGYCKRYQNEVIVSIWKQDFEIPTYIKPVSADLVLRAKKLYIENIQVARN